MIRYQVEKQRRQSSHETMFRIIDSAILVAVIVLMSAVILELPSAVKMSFNVYTVAVYTDEFGTEYYSRHPGEQDMSVLSAGRSFEAGGFVPSVREMRELAVPGEMKYLHTFMPDHDSFTERGSSWSMLYSMTIGNVTAFLLVLVGNACQCSLEQARAILTGVLLLLIVVLIIVNYVQARRREEQQELWEVPMAVRKRF